MGVFFYWQLYEVVRELIEFLFRLHECNFLSRFWISYQTFFLTDGWRFLHGTLVGPASDLHLDTYAHPSNLGIHAKGEADIPPPHVNDSGEGNSPLSSGYMYALIHLISDNSWIVFITSLSLFYWLWVGALFISQSYQVRIYPDYFTLKFKCKAPLINRSELQRSGFSCSLVAIFSWHFTLSESRCHSYVFAFAKKSTNSSETELHQLQKPYNYILWSMPQRSLFLKKCQDFTF